MNSAAAMFAKFFGKFNPTPPNNALQGSEKLTDLEATVSVHYGIPSTVSILAFDPFQQLLAIGTLDGRIKVIRGSNVEGLLFSPKPLPFKNLEFLQNQGFLVGVSNVNEIQIWDLENRRISSNLQWESNITAFSVIYDTHHMFVGDEYGYLSVLKYEGREGSIELLPYHIPPNLIAGVDFIGKLLRFQCPTNLPLLVYFPNLVHMETEVRAALVREFKQLQSKDEIVVYASKSSSEERFRASSDNQEGEKEISSLCWLSYDGSILAVGYVDGDILLWNLSVLGKKSSEAEASSSYVKLQLSAGGRRLPAIILRWCANNAQNGCGGQLFVYGGDSIGSDEALTVAMLDVSSASVLFITDCLSSSSSRITSVAVKTLGDALEDTMEHCEEGRTNPYVKEVISVLTRDADVVLLDGSTGRKISFQAKHPKEMSTAISLCILGTHYSFILINLCRKL
ncbi:syntaxin-binding protein 5-like isoform X6 [Capsicum annuum]|uniref:syntaxin-binding protein 5-like isoform X6 n=1 Tax=Capsicum annuum TaxID=4072 RepID=UPI001FB0CEB6|nr:syntaxin-binding protein 5-like isoform X6 [Capsicum annuum]